MTEISHLTIAFSSYFNDRESYERVVTNVLFNKQPKEITSINDSLDFVKTDPRFSGTKIKRTKCHTKIEARRIVSISSHIICFWSGSDLVDLIWEAAHRKIPLRLSTFSHTHVVNIDAGDKYDVYIGRRGPWGNPFPIVPGTDETREKVIEKYADYFEKNIITDPHKHSALLALRGLRLGCHCKPLACHGDVIARYLNNYREPDTEPLDDKTQDS